MTATLLQGNKGKGIAEKVRESKKKKEGADFKALASLLLNHMTEISADKVGVRVNRLL